MEKRQEHRKTYPLRVPADRVSGRRHHPAASLTAISGLSILLVALGVGCDEVQRHNVLTFFFEGVPPVDKDFRPSASVYVTNTGGLPTGAGQPKFDTPRSAQRRGSRHVPAPDCTQCHASSFRQYERELLVPLPQLCYTCHKSYESLPGRLHGPVAVGECVICHNPHQSGYVHLQVAPQPDLCYRCHDVEDMATVAGHDKMEKTICTDCHDPHASEREKLLKAAVASPPDPNAID